jgi:hypothetical protein
LRPLDWTSWPLRGSPAIWAFSSGTPAQASLAARSPRGPFRTVGTGQGNSLAGMSGTRGLVVSSTVFTLDSWLSFLSFSL